MLNRFLSLITITVAIPAASAQTDPGFYRKAEASYLIYRGSLGDMMASRSSDKKIAFSIHGRSARELFEAIGPDKKDACLEGTVSRVRYRNEEKLYCTSSKQGEYRWGFGFDPRTGKSIAGSIC